MGVQAQQHSTAAAYFGDLAGQAIECGNEDWQAGGALPDILHGLRRDGHIDDELYIIGNRLMNDMQRCHGSSAGVSRYGDQIDAGASNLVPGRHRTDIDAFQRMDRVLTHLRRHERELLTFCVLSRELPHGGLADWGKAHSRYATSKTARAYTTGQVVAMLRTVGELYRNSNLHPG